MELTSTEAALPPTVTVCAEIEPTATGDRFAAFTVTEMSCFTLKPPSLAVTVMVAPPTATGVIFTVEPVTLAVALAVSDDATV